MSMTPGSTARTGCSVAAVGMINPEDAGHRAVAGVTRPCASTTSDSGSPDRCEWATCSGPGFVSSLAVAASAEAQPRESVDVLRHQFSSTPDRHVAPRCDSAFDDLSHIVVGVLGRQVDPQLLEDPAGFVDIRQVGKRKFRDRGGDRELPTLIELMSSSNRQ